MKANLEGNFLLKLQVKKSILQQSKSVSCVLVQEHGKTKFSCSPFLSVRAWVHVYERALGGKMIFTSFSISAIGLSTSFKEHIFPVCTILFYSLSDFTLKYSITSQGRRLTTLQWRAFKLPF